MQRTVTAFSPEERKRLEIEIEAALKARGWWEKPEDAARPVEGNLEQIAVARLDWKEGIRGTSKNTRIALQCRPRGR